MFHKIVLLVYFLSNKCSLGKHKSCKKYFKKAQTFKLYVKLNSTRKIPLHIQYMWLIVTTQEG